MISGTQYEREGHNRQMSLKANRGEQFWIPGEVRKWQNNRPVAFLSCLYPAFFDPRNRRTDMTHLLSQIFQRCPRLGPGEADIKRLFWEEIDGEGISSHIHAVIQCPKMDPARFKRIVIQRAEHILNVRGARPSKQKLVHFEWSVDLQNVVSYCQKRNTSRESETIRDRFLGQSSIERIGIRQSDLLLHDVQGKPVRGYSTALCVL